MRALPSRGPAAKAELDELCNRCEYFHEQAQALVQWDKQLFDVVPDGMLSSDEEESLDGVEAALRLVFVPAQFVSTIFIYFQNVQF